MWSEVRLFIERLDVRGVHIPFAWSAERFENDLEQAWAAWGDGEDLLWLAACVGVDYQQIVVAAKALLEGVLRQTKRHGPLERRLGRQMAQVLEQVQAWGQGKQSTERIMQASLELYELCEDPAKDYYPFAEAMDHLAQAVFWLTGLVDAWSPPRLPDAPDEPFERAIECLVDQAAQAWSLQQVGGDEEVAPEGYRRALASARQRFADVVRQHITGAQVQEAAHKQGLWPPP
ncbi:MAG TPA: hypothetical protein VKT82_25130 [Ktedonobacterales bacterium]|nr:hypothetical protein [Ktedonobacterales bacterium]